MPAGLSEGFFNRDEAETMKLLRVFLEVLLFKPTSASGAYFLDEEPFLWCAGTSSGVSPCGGTYLLSLPTEMASSE